MFDTNIISDMKDATGEQCYKWLATAGANELQLRMRLYALQNVTEQFTVK
jgi:hypothetical protein